MRKKRGLSPIIASVLIILLTIVGVTVIAGFVVPFVRENLSGATECLPYQTYFEFDERFGYNCFDFDSGDVFISVKANPLQNPDDAQLNELRVVLAGEAESISVAVKEGDSPGDVAMLGDSGDNLKVPDSGEAHTYVYSGGANFKSMELYPVLESGRICDMSDSINLKRC